jgi:hypothetical protein
MAFFSIAMTLNITGVRLSDLRPSAISSFMERRLTMAYTPIIRYYDNSRLAYEVQTTMRELRQTTGVGEQGEGEENQQKQQDLAPGESKKGPGNGGRQSAPPLQPDTLAAGPDLQPPLYNSAFLESSPAFQHWSAHSGGSRKEIWERSTVWTA